MRFHDFVLKSEVVDWDIAKQKNTLAEHVLDIISDLRCACVFL